jgi:diguanylate cyclase (GGDEF)-like protein
MFGQMHRRLSKNNRVLALIASLAISSFVVGGVVYFVSSQQASEIRQLSTRITQLDTLSNGISLEINHAEDSLGDYVLTGADLAQQRYDAAIAGELAAADEFRAIATGMDTVLAALERLETASLDWRDRIADPAIRAIRSSDSAGVAIYKNQISSDAAGVDGALGSLGRELARQHSDIQVREREVEATTMVGVIVGFGFMITAFAVAIVAVRRFGRALEGDARDASVLNRFTELTSFADEDRQVAAANLVALGRLASPDASVTHLLNRSMDRAVPEASTGDAPTTVLPLHELGRCAGLQRGAMFVTDDLSDELSVHCPIFPASTGTLVCIPLISGESVGAVHLYWHKPRGLPLQRRSAIARVTEHAALAIGNRRLLAALHGQANTDARTGLANSRAFDLALESALEARVGDEVLSVLMLDIDHFKDFNDRHGHPAGDEALRAFANTLRACMRDGDIAARYGGEEFAVYLPGIDHASALGIAERIRARTEAMIVSLAPGLTDRLTISAGVATAPDHGQDRVTLLRLADQALYIAKTSGRNRVGSMQEPGPAGVPDHTETETAAA